MGAGGREEEGRSPKKLLLSLVQGVLGLLICPPSSPMALVPGLFRIISSLSCVIQGHLARLTGFLEKGHGRRMKPDRRHGEHVQCLLG